MPDTTTRPVTAAEDYAARREDLAQRYDKYAAGARARAQTLQSGWERIHSIIPLGQPVLVGHHSERRHRRDLARAERLITRATEESGKAEYWKRKAAYVRNERIIRSKDPAATTKLRAKLALLEAEQTRRRAINAAFRKGGLDAAKNLLTPDDIADLDRVARYQSYYRPHERGFPPYALSNLAGNIRSVKKRIEALER